MNMINHPVTGYEDCETVNTPLSALTRFYRAFNSRDIDSMEQNWLQGPDSSMSNPLGGVMRSWNDIRGVYQKIFSGPATVYVEFYNYTIHNTDQMFVAVGHERGTITVNNIVLDLAIRTSRIFLMKDSRWKQIHHHGSIDNPALLNDYQQLIKTGKTGDK